MEKLWRAAFAVAGLAAIAFFVLWSLYKQWLSLPIFAQLTSTQTFVLMGMFLLLVFAALTVGCFTWLKGLSRNALVAQDDPEYLIYQAAFLWHGVKPPSIERHFEEMTHDIAETKARLHQAVEMGQLAVSRELVVPGGGCSRWVRQSELRRFALSIGDVPEFLK